MEPHEFAALAFITLAFGMIFAARQAFENHFD